MKWIVMFGFALFCCLVVAHFAPGVSGVLFNLGPVGINGTMLIFIGACVLVLRAKR